QKNVHLSHQDMREFHLERSFALCIVPFRAFLHLLTISDQDKALDQIHKHLRRRGKLVLDIFAPSYELLAQGTTNLHLEQKLNPETNNKITIKDQVRYEHAKQIIYVERCYEEREENGQVHRKIMPFTLRYIFRYEMQAILEKNEFQLKEVYGGFDKRPYDYQSGEMIFVAEKVG
ncbi:MAG: class I SAM-dependent methyltransferase, partial [bacterium]